MTPSGDFCIHEGCRTQAAGAARGAAPLMAVDLGGEFLKVGLLLCAWCPS